MFGCCLLLCLSVMLTVGLLTDVVLIDCCVCVVFVVCLLCYVCCCWLIVFVV